MFYTSFNVLQLASQVGGVKSGVAKKAKLVSVKMIGCDGSTDTLVMAKAIEWVTKDRLVSDVRCGTVWYIVHWECAAWHLSARACVQPRFNRARVLSDFRSALCILLRQLPWLYWYSLSWCGLCRLRLTFAR